MSEPRKIEEFWCIWFASTQDWKVIFPNNKMLAGNFTTTEEALDATYRLLDKSESEFIGSMPCMNAFRYTIKDEEPIAADTNQGLGGDS